MCLAAVKVVCVVFGVVICLLMVQSFTPYRTAQRPIVTATQVGSHIRVGETSGCAVQLLSAVSPFSLGWWFALSSRAVLGNRVVWALSSLETYLTERMKRVSAHARCSEASLAWLSSFRSRWAKRYRWWVEQILSCFASCVSVWECGFSFNCL